ncbi:hypothetical protein [Microtetraspora malaysiensis]|uniref:hypothetical protein n=1 Tax=Microtetraspora malaysiensis TaxID=161358 RepID=UPI0008341DB6|nr:hypothetical protein [Microtetraspora malaysiensis]
MVCSATTSHLPALGNAADDAVVHAMHVGAVWIMFIALFGAAVLLLALCAIRKPAAAGGAPEPARDGGPTADETAPRAEAEDLTAREGDDVGTR